MKYLNYIILLTISLFFVGCGDNPMQCRESVESKFSKNAEVFNLPGKSMNMLFGKQMEIFGMFPR